MSNESDHESLSAQDDSPSEVEQLVTRLQALQNKGLPPRDFLPEFLQHTLASIAAVGGAIWSSTSLGVSLECLHGMRDTGIDDDECDRQRHAELLMKVLDGGEPVIIPPRPEDGSVEATGDGNSSLYWLLIVPFRGPDGIALALEAYLRRGGGPSFRQDRLRVVVLATEMGSQYLERWQARRLAESGAEKSPDRGQFDLAVHASLDLRRTAYTIAHEARRFLDVDRVTVTVERRGRQRAVAISNQESFDSRAAAVQALEKLATTIAATGEPFSYLGVHSELAPQIHAALHAHLEQSHSQVVFVVPLHRGATDNHFTSESETSVAKLSKGGPPDSAERRECVPCQAGRDARRRRHPLARRARGMSLMWKRVAAGQHRGRPRVGRCRHFAGQMSRAFHGSTLPPPGR